MTRIYYTNNKQKNIIKIKNVLPILNTDVVNQRRTSSGWMGATPPMDANLKLTPTLYAKTLGNTGGKFVIKS